MSEHFRHPLDENVEVTAHKLVSGQTIRIPQRLRSRRREPSAPVPAQPGLGALVRGVLDVLQRPRAGDGEQGDGAEAWYRAGVRDISAVPPCGEHGAWWGTFHHRLFILLRPPLKPDDFTREPCRWEYSAPRMLRQRGIRRSRTRGRSYSTSRYVGDAEPAALYPVQVGGPGVDAALNVEVLPEEIADVWRTRELQFAADSEIGGMGFLAALAKSLDLIRLSAPLLGTVAGICRSLHVLLAPDRSFDVSFSDPCLPFFGFRFLPAGQGAGTGWSGWRKTGPRGAAFAAFPGRDRRTPGHRPAGGGTGLLPMERARAGPCAAFFTRCTYSETSDVSGNASPRECPVHRPSRIVGSRPSNSRWRRRFTSRRADPLTPAGPQARGLVSRFLNPGVSAGDACRRGARRVGLQPRSREASSGTAARRGARSSRGPASDRADGRAAQRPSAGSGAVSGRRPRCPPAPSRSRPRPGGGLRGRARRSRGGRRAG